MPLYIDNSIQNQTATSLTEKYGHAHNDRIRSGVLQVAGLWREEDGSGSDFSEFCLNNFYGSPEKRDRLFDRLEKNLESLYGNFYRVSRDFYWHLHVETGPMLPVDQQFANFNVFAHVSEDLFKSKIAFTVLLNFGIKSLAEKSREGPGWSRRQWAEARLADLFTTRIPANAKSKRSEAYVTADEYISSYNFYMKCLVNEKGQQLFRDDLKLISHWGLRDELKAQYAYPDGLARQQMIQEIMMRVIKQEVPRDVINSDAYVWDPFKNVLAGKDERQVKTETENSQRYERLRNIFLAEKSIDPYTPSTPSLIDRRFKESREIPKPEVEGLLQSILSAPVAKDIASLIRRRLGRELEPFDIWYDGFRSPNAVNEKELDGIVKRAYADIEGLKKFLPDILIKLGFSKDKSQELAALINVDPARGAGHAAGAMLRGDSAHLRTRVPDGGIDYKGFNTAMHELGHTVEQTISLNHIDHYLLEGVPNTAFTEAFAFAFQARDLEVLGVEQKDEMSRIYKALNNYWATLEISGVAMVDIKIWDWMYDHPDCSAPEIQDAILGIARGVWNEYFAPVFGRDDEIILAVYSHIINSGMYIPDYPLGHIISYQIEEFIKSRDLASETERMCRLGRLTPQFWMKQAVGGPISTTPLIQAAGEAFKALAGK